MIESVKWKCAAKYPALKIKKERLEIEKMLRENEADYVSACGRFLSLNTAKDSVWLLRSKSDEIKSLLINSRSTLMPIFAGLKEIPQADFLDTFLRKKNIYSIQGLATEVSFLEEALATKGMNAKDIIDYDLMSLDMYSIKNVSKKCPANLELYVPQPGDFKGLAPLQAGYEQEEVIPKGSIFNPASSMANITNIIKSGRILAAKLDGQFVGKINVNAVSFTRYQVGGVYVRPEFRGLGIAGKMTYEFVNSLINEGRGVTLFVKKANMAALRLYRSLGFSVKNDYRITYY